MLSLSILLLWFSFSFLFLFFHHLIIINIIIILFSAKKRDRKLRTKSSHKKFFIPYRFFQIFLLIWWIHRSKPLFTFRSSFLTINSKGNCFSIFGTSPSLRYVLYFYLEKFLCWIHMLLEGFCDFKKLGCFFGFICLLIFISVFWNLDLLESELADQIVVWKKRRILTNSSFKPYPSVFPGVEFSRFCFRRYAHGFSVLGQRSASHWKSYLLILLLFIMLHYCCSNSNFDGFWVVLADF